MNRRPLPKGPLMQLENASWRGDFSMALTSLMDCPGRQLIFQMSTGDMSCWLLSIYLCVLGTSRRDQGEKRKQDFGGSTDGRDEVWQLGNWQNGIISSAPPPPISLSFQHSVQMRSHEIKTGILKATTFPHPNCLLTQEFQSCTKSLLHPGYAGYCSDPTGLHCLELHIPTGCGSQSNSKFGATTLSLPSDLFPSQMAHSQGS